MQVRLAVLAESANQSSDGKLNILGEFNLIWAAALPVVWPRLFLILKLEADLNDAPTKKLRIRVVDEDAHPVSHTLEGEADLTRRFRPGIPVIGVLILEFRNAVFSKTGTYEFEVTADGEPLVSVPLYVIPVQERVAEGG